MMAGCFGSSREDRYFEAQLDRYLDSLDFGPCEECGAHAETQCVTCNKELCEDCAYYMDDEVYCEEHKPECACGETENLIKCEESGEWCCGPEKHNCEGCREGEDVFTKGEE